MQAFMAGAINQYATVAQISELPEDEAMKEMAKLENELAGYAIEQMVHHQPKNKPVPDVNRNN